MNEFYTFIITSTINTKKITGVNVFDSENRFIETLKTIESIREKVKNSRIIFIDNSSEPLSDIQTNYIKHRVDKFHQIEHNIFTLFVNKIGSKGMGESYMMYKALELIEENNLLGKRVFKITGRYWLADSFDISYYDDPKLIGKFAHKINQWDVSKDNFFRHRERVVYFETRLWSFCYTLFDEYKLLIQDIFKTMLINIGEPMCNLEMCHWQLTPLDNVFEVETIHIEGHTADNGLYKFE